MKRRLSLMILAVLVAVAAGAGLSQVAAGSASNQEESVQQQLQNDAPQAAPAAEVPLRAPNLISIPFGIADVLHLSDDHERITVIGHGSCTQGEEVTVSVTITQTGSTAMGSGQTQQPCSGESQLQYWLLEAISTGTPDFAEGAATACGEAVTRDSEGTVTDTYEWCKEMTLSHRRATLPLLIRD